MYISIWTSYLTVTVYMYMCLCVEYAGHSHMMFVIVEKTSDGGYMAKPLKQKQMMDGLCYLLQEVYGIENKNSERNKVRSVTNNCVQHSIQNKFKYSHL